MYYLGVHKHPTKNWQREKICANSTPCSQAVSHPSTDEARGCLTLGFFGSRSSYNFIPFFKVCLICISTTTLGIIDLIIDLFSFSSEETRWWNFFSLGEVYFFRRNVILSRRNVILSNNLRNLLLWVSGC